MSKGQDQLDMLLSCPSGKTPFEHAAERLGELLRTIAAQRDEIERLQSINADLRKLAARMEQLTDLALFTNELMADEEFTDLYLRWQGFDPEQVGKDMQQIALDAMKKAQGTEDNDN